MFTLVSWHGGIIKLVSVFLVFRVRYLVYRATHCVAGRPALLFTQLAQLSALTKKSHSDRSLP